MPASIPEETIRTEQECADAFTVGVEEEYQLVDPASGGLRSAASDVRALDWSGDLVAELQETTIEVGTPVCASAQAVRAELQRLRFQAATAAEAGGVSLIAAGLHPFSGWEGHRRPCLERYQQMELRYGRIARDEHIFGMHVHVAVPEGHDRYHLANVARHFLPLLLALAASSPFLDGSDTGFDSYRTILWRRWPSSGIPPRFRSAAEYEQYVETLFAAGAIADRFNLYWSLRVHPRYPTLEFRVTDVCPTLADAVAVAALARALVHAIAQGRIEDESGRRHSSGIEQELLRTNEWHAARHGLHACFIDARGSDRSMRADEAVRRLLELVAPSADELGDTDALGQVETILERGNAATRLRAVHAARGTGAVLDWLRTETLAGTGADRRAAPRAAPA